MNSIEIEQLCALVELAETCALVEMGVEVTEYCEQYA